MDPRRRSTSQSAALPAGAWLLLAASFCAASSCAAPPSSPPPSMETKPTVVDLHVDLAHAIAAKGRDPDDPSGATSPERLRKGRVSHIVLPLFIAGAHELPPAEARRRYDETFESLTSALRSSTALTLPGQPALPGRIATILAFEGADGFADDPRAAEEWIQRGACLFGLLHHRTNALAASSQEPDPHRRSAGLLPPGRELAETIYRAGGLIDVAHASDAAFDDIAEIAERHGAPIVDSHTGVRALVDIERNIDDERLKIIASSGGVAAIDLHSGHICPRPGETATLEDVADHIVHAAAVAGVEHVAIGSDLEGGIEPPGDSDGEASWQRLAEILRKRGWSASHIDAVFGENARRVLAGARAAGCRGAASVRGANDPR